MRLSFTEVLDESLLNMIASGPQGPSLCKSIPHAAKNVDREKTTATSIAEEYFNLILIITNNDRKNEQFINDLGITLTEDALFELSIYHAYTVSKAICLVPLELNIKKTILRDIWDYYVDHFYSVEGEITDDVQEEYDTNKAHLMKVVNQRFAGYDQAYNKIFVEATDASMIQAAEIIYSNLKLIVPKIDSNNFLSLLPFMSYFSFEIKALLPEFSAHLNAFEIEDKSKIGLIRDKMREIELRRSKNDKANIQPQSINIYKQK